MRKPDTAPDGGRRPGGDDPAPAQRPAHDTRKDHPASPDVDPDDAKTVPEREEALDEALDQTFPASDPPSTTPQPPVKPKS